MAKESDARFIMKQEQDSAPISRSLKIGFSLIFVKNMKVPRPIKAPQTIRFHEKLECKDSQME